MSKVGGAATGGLKKAGNAAKKAANKTGAAEARCRRKCLKSNASALHSYALDFHL